MTGKRADEFRWTEEHVARAREMWAAGETVAAIGRVFGLTKNTVVSLARRKGFPKRPSPIKFLDPGISPKVRGPRRLRAAPLPGQASAICGNGAIKGNTLPPVQRAKPDSRRTTPVERQHASGTAARMPLTGPTLPALVSVTEHSAPVVVVRTGHVGKCAWLNGTRHNYIACDAPTVPGKSYCNEHCTVCLVGWSGGQQHDNEHTKAA